MTIEHMYNYVQPFMYKKAMSRTFAYARVSSVEQNPENQIREIEAAGFAVEPHRVITETVSGSRGCSIKWKRVMFLSSPSSTG